MRPRRVRMGWVALVSVLSAVPIAQATPADDVEHAKVHFRVGEGLYQLGNYVEAIREFNEGYRLVHRPIFLLNIGQAYRKLDDPRHALESFNRYLEVTPPEDPRRSEVEDIVSALRREPIPEPEPTPAPPAPPVEHIAVAELVAAPPKPQRKKWVIPVAISVSAAVVLAVGLGVGLTYGVNRFDCAHTTGCLDVKQGR